MRLDKAITTAYTRKWSMINTFTVDINMTAWLEDRVGKFNEDINMSIVNFTTPDYTNNPIEVFISNRWVVQNGRDELYRFTVTFRDYDQLSLYKKFMQIYKLTKENYFDDVKLVITLSKDDDWGSEKEPNKFATYDGVLIEGVSNIAFDNTTENQIAEFTVSFKCTKPSIEGFVKPK